MSITAPGDYGLADMTIVGGWNATARDGSKIQGGWGGGNAASIALALPTAANLLLDARSPNPFTIIAMDASGKSVTTACPATGGWYAPKPITLLSGANLNGTVTIKCVNGTVNLYGFVVTSTSIVAPSPAVKPGLASATVNFSDGTSQSYP